MENFKDALNSKPTICISTGWLIKEDKDVHILVADVNFEDNGTLGDVGNITTIPSSNVLKKKNKIMRYCFDIETDGFLDTATKKVHCIILKDIDTKQILHLNNEEAVKKLEQAELIIGHNIIKFDIPVLKKFYNLKSKSF